MQRLMCALILVCAACALPPKRPYQRPVADPPPKLPPRELGGNEYVKAVYVCVHDNYRMSGPRPEPNLVTRVVFRVAEDGRFSEPEVTQSSGVPTLDAAAAQAVRSCGSVGPPPAEARSTLARDGLEIHFAP